MKTKHEDGDPRENTNMWHPHTWRNKPLQLAEES